MDTAHRPATLWTRDFVLLVVGTFLQGSAFYFLLPVLPLFVVGPMQGDESTVGVAVGVFALAAVLVRPFAGWLLDRYGRRIGLLVASALFSASMFGW